MSGSVVKRLVVGAITVGIVLYALQGGEYGTTDLARQRTRKRSLLADIDTLRRQIDSLARLKKRLETDPLLQERIAREEFGMVRGEKEVLYRFADPRPPADSAPLRRGKP